MTITSPSAAKTHNKDKAVAIKAGGSLKVLGATKHRMSLSFRSAKTSSTTLHKNVRSSSIVSATSQAASILQINNQMLANASSTIKFLGGNKPMLGLPSLIAPQTPSITASVESMPAPEPVKPLE